MTAVDGQYQIGIYSVRPIAYGEEITFDYNSVTEVSKCDVSAKFEILFVLFLITDCLQSKEEYEASVCLCGNQVCRGSYLNLTGEGAFQKVRDFWTILVIGIQISGLQVFNKFFDYLHLHWIFVKTFFGKGCFWHSAT